MNAAHLHIMINHVAVLGVVFGLLMGAWGLAFRKSDFVRVALVAFVIAGLATVVTYYSGESAEEMVEHMAGVSETVLETHEDAAKPATIGAVLLGVVAFISLVYWRAREFPRGVASAVLVAGLALTLWNAYVANLGGEIRHPEIRGGAAVVMEPADDDD